MYGIEGESLRVEKELKFKVGEWGWEVEVKGRGDRV